MLAAIEELLARSEQRTRELIAAIPDGVYSFDDVLDDVGPGTAPIRFCVDVTIKADEAVVVVAAIVPDIAFLLDLVTTACLNGRVYFFFCGGRSVQWPSNTSAAMPMDSPSVGCG